MNFRVKFSDKTYRMPVKFDAGTAVSTDNTAAATFEMIDAAIDEAFKNPGGDAAGNKEE